MFALAALLLCLSLRDIQWKVVSQTVASISADYALLAVALGQVPLLLRACRWRILLQAEAPVTYGTTFWAVAAGYFGNNFLPARGGEVVRSCIVQSRSSLTVPYVLATALSERAADAVALVIFGGVAMAFLPQVQTWMKLVRMSFLLIGVAGLTALALIPRLEGFLGKMLQRWPRLQNVMRQVVLGVCSLHDGSRLLQFALLTIAIWFIDAAATSLLANSLAIAMPMRVSMLLIVALSLASAIPSTPGYVGVYQFVAVMVLKPLGIAPSIAIAFMLVLQVMSYAVTTLLGLLAILWFTPVRWRDFGRQARPIQIQN
jgi:uncharacterized protein (TIRG00374 family)